MSANKKLLNLMLKMATDGHDGQRTRDDNPYILHPLTVALGFESTDIDAMIVAIGHDLFEDSDKYKIDDLPGMGFPIYIVDALRCMTHRDDEPYEDYIERIAKNPLATRVKIKDLEHNMDIRRLDVFTDKDVGRLQKYHRAWVRLRAVQGITR